MVKQLVDFSPDLTSEKDRLVKLEEYTYANVFEFFDEIGKKGILYTCEGGEIENPYVRIDKHSSFYLEPNNYDGYGGSYSMGEKFSNFFEVFQMFVSLLKKWEDLIGKYRVDNGYREDYFDRLNKVMLPTSYNLSNLIDDMRGGYLISQDGWDEDLNHEVTMHLLKNQECYEMVNQSNYDCWIRYSVC